MEASLELLSGRLHLVMAPRAVGYPLLNSSIARLALAGPVRVIDGGNGFDVHAIARQLRTHTADMGIALQRIQIARAFTCYQMLALLAQQIPQPNPLLVMDFLATFADENVPVLERLRLLEQAVGYLVTLSFQSTLAISVSPSADGECLARLETALRASDDSRLAVWRYEMPIERQPLQLF